MRLSPRLLKIAGLVPEHSVVADIGTDHALLPVYLVVSGKCPRAIATDVRPGPLAAARETVESFAVERQLDLRLGFGLTVLSPREADVIVLAGLGGATIVEVLERSPLVVAAVRRLVLQPMNDAASVRRWLLDHAFSLAEEDLVREGGRIYEVLAAEPLGTEGRDRLARRAGESAGRLPAGGLPAGVANGREGPAPARGGTAAGWDPLLEETGLEVGPRLWGARHPLLREFLEQKRDRCRHILDQIEAGGLPADHGDHAGFRDKLARLERLLAVLTEADGLPPSGGGPGAGT